MRAFPAKKLTAGIAAASLTMLIGAATANAETLPLRKLILLDSITIPSAPSTTSTPAPSNPLQGERFYGPHEDAMKTVAQWTKSRPSDAAAMQYIANQPSATWIGGWSGDPASAVNTEVSAAAAQNKVAVVVAYNIPNRDCGQYSAGGASGEAEYDQWIDGFAAGIGHRKTVVILEPDALAQLCDAEPRYRMINHALDALAKQDGAITYVDIGVAGWLTTDEAAKRLQQAGVSKARGFSVNVSNFVDTPTSIKYADEIAGRTHSHYVIDTSRNGRGATADHQWCNPEGRGLGKPPTTTTDSKNADAYLWIKTVGQSDGSCNGAPAAGTFMPEYALGLAQRRA